MTPEELTKWRQAGKIAAEALAFGRKLIVKGANIREVCDKIDAKIIELGARPAWPTQVGLNDYAAHATPDPDDDRTFKDEIVCLDVGAHIDGYVGDNACTVDLSGKHTKLVQATADAVEAARKILRVGAKISDVSKAIQQAIETHGFNPVRNLTGHTISQWTIHDDPAIPNHDTGDDTQLQKGQVIAIEPFATDGNGSVYELDQANLFSFTNKRPVRSTYAREALSIIEREYGHLPFTTRWLAQKMGAGKAGMAIRELMRAGSLHEYPPLVETGHGMVAVTEATFLIDDKVERLTPWVD